MLPVGIDLHRMGIALRRHMAKPFDDRHAFPRITGQPNQRQRGVALDQRVQRGARRRVAAVVNDETGQGEGRQTGQYVFYQAAVVVARDNHAGLKGGGL